MDLHVLMVIHTLPLWFLVFSLFLPRVALGLLWLEGGTQPFHLNGLIPLIVAVLLPRVLVLYMIYVDQGLSLWFIIHLIAVLFAWGGSGNYYSRRRRDRDS
ncbi:MAG: hypothetical protein M3O31_10725 [Acidobacteriota bacterium]|nr:hypothetical protein [Acidobacteriota bacterium]